MSHLKTAKKYAYVGIVQMVEVEVWLVDCRFGEVEDDRLPRQYTAHSYLITGSC
jgi:hypothetical protein